RPKRGPQSLVITVRAKPRSSVSALEQATDGTCGCRHCRAGDSLATGASFIAYQLASKYWRRGIGTAAVAAMPQERTGQGQGRAVVLRSHTRLQEGESHAGPARRGDRSESSACPVCVRRRRALAPSVGRKRADAPTRHTG